MAKERLSFSVAICSGPGSASSGFDGLHHRLRWDSYPGSYMKYSLERDEMKVWALRNCALRMLFVAIVPVIGLGAYVVQAEAGMAPAQSSGVSMAAYPLKLSANHRYLVDRKGKPFLIVGDSPQDMMSRLTEKEVDSYFADRQAHGFNTMGWIDVTCAGKDSPDNKDSRTVDGILPFTGFVPGGTSYEYYDLSKPNEAYFARLDHIVMLAKKHGILVFLNPMETNGWLPTLRNNGLTSAYSFGQYLGNRYKGLQTWPGSAATILLHGKIRRTTHW